jgi:hypothetical protein
VKFDATQVLGVAMGWDKNFHSYSFFFSLSFSISFTRQAAEFAFGI